MEAFLLVDWFGDFPIFIFSFFFIFIFIFLGVLGVSVRRSQFVEHCG
jgi:hypothetical protein